MVNYREAYRMYVCNGILFKHESPLRGETFLRVRLREQLLVLNLVFREKFI